MMTTKNFTGRDRRTTVLVSTKVAEKERLTMNAKTHDLSLFTVFRFAADVYMNTHNW